MLVRAPSHRATRLVAPAQQPVRDAAQERELERETSGVAMAAASERLGDLGGDGTIIPRADAHVAGLAKAQEHACVRVEAEQAVGHVADVVVAPQPADGVAVASDAAADRV